MKTAPRTRKRLHTHTLGIAALLLAHAMGGCASTPHPAPDRIRCAPELVARSRQLPQGVERWCETTGGFREGPYELRDSEGRISITGGYRSDEQSGSWTTYDWRGQPVMQLDYRAGVWAGEALIWHPSGNLTSRTQYAPGLGPSEETATTPAGAAVEREDAEPVPTPCIGDAGGEARSRPCAAPEG